MNSIIQQIEDWLKTMLVSGIMSNLSGAFDTVNDQVGQIATDVGTAPANFLPGVYSLIRNISETVILPIAGIILTFIACYELIQLVISHNNLANFETWIFWKWVFKTFVAVTLISNTFTITMAIFDVAQHVVQQSGGIITGSTAIDQSTLSSMQTTLEPMELGPLFGVLIQSFVVQIGIHVLSIIIFIIINGRMVEIYLMTICNLWKQRAEHDGTELCKIPFRIGISGIFDHDLCGNLCSDAHIRIIFVGYCSFLMESLRLHSITGVYPVQDRIISKISITRTLSSRRKEKVRWQHLIFQYPEI